MSLDLPTNPAATPSRMTKTRVLVVDDEPDIRQLLQDILEDEHYAVLTVENASLARSAYSTFDPDLILLDIWMPQEDGISLLNDWFNKGLSCPVIMMSGHATVETAVEATRLGAYDFLEKPLSMAKLLVTLEHALEHVSQTQELPVPRRRGETAIEPMGKSATMERLRDQARRLAVHDTCVLLLGEPGTGKATLARYLHANSARRDEAFVDVSIGVLDPDHSVADWLGQANGGYHQRGLLEQARGGTLYLNEVAHLDDDAQLRVLGVLESHPTMDVRIIASTQCSLEDEVRYGRFRAELFYRLNAVTLRVPPLREHGEDIPELLRFYVDYFVGREKLAYRRFPVPVQNHLRHLPWPGNIRELKNLVQRLLILGSGEEINLEEVKSALDAASAAGNLPGRGEPPDFYELPLKEAREHFEKAYLEYHLQKYRGNVARLSQAIGLERTHLYRKLNALGIRFKEKR
ncbi:MAG: sigma-54-dependent transcriptional regulator [Methylococcaceae bacterium]